MQVEIPLVIGRCCHKGCKNEIVKIGNKKFCDFHKRERKRLYMDTWNEKRRIARNSLPRKIYDSKCELCGNQFMAERQHAKWCSRRCKQANATILRSEKKITQHQKIIEDIKNACMQ